MIGSDAHNAKQLEELALLEPVLEELGGFGGGFVEAEGVVGGAGFHKPDWAKYDHANNVGIDVFLSSINLSC